MVGFEMFCERCGKRYGNGEASRSTSLPLSKRLLKAVGVSASAPEAPADEPLLRFCLACRGYSCAECWNDGAGFCQTCVPVDEPAAELPVINVPALETPAPQMSFEDEMPPYLAMLASQTELQQVDPLAGFVAEAEVEALPEPQVEAEAVAGAEALVPEALAEPEAQAEFELEPQAEVEADNQAEAQALVPEALAEAEAQAELDAQTEPEPALAAEPALAFESEPLDEVVPVAAQQAVVEATSTGVEAAAETLALDERPIELVFADEETAAESEPETTWDWSFVSETEAEPIEASEPDAEPIAASAEESADAGALVDAPHVPAQPQSLPPPVYRPLPPLGPIVPPPPPAATSPRPTIDFEILEPPPAFVIAPPQAQALMRPQLPAGLFDGPAPQIRPCHQCELPVSAKARFCRRCGSAQPV